MTRRPIFVLGAFGLVMLILLALWTPLLSGVRGWVWGAIVAATARGFEIGAIEVRPDVMDQLARLQADNVRLQAEVARFERLAAQLGTPLYQDFTTLPAVVAARPIDTFRSRYVINRGTRDGVSLDAPVVVNSSTLVGFVVELSAEAAVFQLLLHPETSVAAEVVPREGESNVPARGLVVGAHYTSAWLTTVPRDQKIEGGQSVVTVAREQSLPAGLVLGTIGEIRSEESEAYQRATLELPYDVDQLEAVAVLLPTLGR